MQVIKTYGGVRLCCDDDETMFYWEKFVPEDFTSYCGSAGSLLDGIWVRCRSRMRDVFDPAGADINDIAEAIGRHEMARMVNHGQ